MSVRTIVIIAIVAIGAYLLTGINTIPTQEQKVQASWAQVENNYQRRMDLIPNLVETVKGEANFEQKTLTDVIEARANATKVTLNVDQLNDAAAVKQFEQAQGALSSTLSRLMMVSENYPTLKANQGFLALQSQLEGTENRITVARMDFINTVQEYNTTVTTFPGRIWAMIYSAKPKANFAASEGADKAPTVKF
ncbi:MAG TPA: LemA family protein [Alphaproteobacteria bacterium]|nr:LemA family protein [Alphaproteobacteria bacterium]